MDRPDFAVVRRIIPPGWALIWSGVQSGLTALAGGRRRFPGQTVLACGLGAGSLALGIVALRRFDRAGTTSMPHDPSEATTLVTDGIYAHTRNPMYCSIVLGLLAHTAWSGRLRTLAAVPGLMLTLRPQIEAEEEALAQLFGDAYADYRARVRRWI